MSAPFISRAIPLTQLAEAAASVLAGYTAIGSFTKPAEMMFITSTLDAAVQLSFDGVHDHLAVPAGNTVPVFIQLDFKNNNMVFPVTTIYVKRIGAPGSGNLYVSAFAAIFP